jgi:hypothetical protein
MITKFAELNSQEIQSTTGTKKMKLSPNAQIRVFKIFTKSVYANAIGSVVREITSNCFDSHQEAKVNTPVIIRLSEDKVTNSKFISFIDYGVGMSPDRMENVFGVYFNSTKGGDNEQIGGFGIGGKTPLAYRRSTGLGEEECDNSFYIITNYEGKRYEYLIFEGQESPEFSDPIITDTTEHNGTEVRIPVLDKDIETFKREMVQQLYYFENIIFEGLVDDQECLSDTEETLTNDYQIVRGKNFLYRGSKYSQSMHVCLGRVAYPINYSNLGLSSSDYRFPVALRLEVGDIDVIISREQLDYNETTIRVLKAKLEEAKKEIIDILVAQYDNIVTLEDYFRVKTSFGIVQMPNGGSFSVGDSIKMKDVNFSNYKYNFMKMPNDLQLFRFFFTAETFGKKPRKSSWRYNDDEDSQGFTGSYKTLIEKNSNLYYYEGDFQRKIIKQAWLKSKHTTYYMLRLKNILDAGNYSIVSDLFNVQDTLIERNADQTEKLDALGNPTPTAYMKSLLELQDEYYEIVRRQCTDYNQIVVPLDFIEERKANRKKLTEEFRNATIPVKIIGGYRSSQRIKLQALFDLRIPVFYGTKDQEYELKDCRRTFEMLWGEKMVISEYEAYYNKFNLSSKKGILFIEVGKNNLKYMEYCKNAKSIEKFKSLYIYRKERAVLEYFQIKAFTQKFYQITDLYRTESFAKVSPEWALKIAEIQKFVDKTDVGDTLDWNYKKQTLMMLYPIDKIVLTTEQEKYMQTIEEIKEMETLNADILKFVKIPYDYEDIEYAPDEFWTVLKKIMYY